MFVELKDSSGGSGFQVEKNDQQEHEVIMKYDCYEWNVHQTQEDVACEIDWAHDYFDHELVSKVVVAVGTIEISLEDVHGDVDVLVYYFDYAHDDWNVYLNAWYC